MTNRPANPQIRTYFGADGKPLNLGYIYFGQPGLTPETNPIQMTWDAAGLVVAPQPFRTVNGYISRNGQPANVFASGDYSTSVYDSRMQLVSTSLNNVDFQTAGTTAAADVTVADAGGFYTGANVEAALQEVGTSLASLATGNLPTGALVDYCGTTAPAGFVMASGGTIGSAASAASERNNADTAALYSLLWTVASVSGGLAIQDSTGAPSSFGGSAAADFGTANKRLCLPDCRGRVRAGKDNMGIGPPAPTTAGRITNAGAGIVGTTLFAVGGTETHVLTMAQLATHTHSLNAHTHTIAHTHTLSAHTHTIAHTHDMSHTHTVPAGVFAGGTPNAGSGDNAGTPVTTSGASSSNTGGSSASNSGAPSSDVTGASSSANSGGPSTSDTVSAGSNTAHLNTQPTIMFNVIIKL